MPSTTFEKLSPEKKERIIYAFIVEFSTHRYDDASISRVVKSLGIAKGSVYQYFNDKLELYLYLKGICEQVKLQYIQGIDRAQFKDFWAYLRELFEAGVQFDLKNTKESKFLYAISKNENSPSVSSHHKEWRNQALALFGLMLQKEVEQGHFRTDVRIETMSFFLVSASVHIGDYMQIYHGADFDENLKTGKNMFAEQRDLLMATVDEFIKLLRAAFDPQKIKPQDS